MINWFDMPAEGLSGGGQFEIKELSATKNGTYKKSGEVYSKVTVNVPQPTGKITITENGTDLDVSGYATADVSVSGGGGGDFSTAEVTIEGETQVVEGLEISSSIAFIEDDEIVCVGNFIETGTYTVVLYKGTQVLYSRVKPTTTSGNVAVEVSGKDYAITISGNCVITAPYIV